MQVTVGVEFGSRTVDVQGPGSQLMLTCIWTVSFIYLGLQLPAGSLYSLQRSSPNGTSPAREPQMNGLSAQHADHKGHF